jgi:tripartite-type tricarboxylate transporter receptor subunit TctC
MYFLQKEFDIKINQVSFDKPSERYGVVVGGQIDILIEQPGDVRAYIESGDLKPVLTIMKERPKAFPDTPSLTDVGSNIEPLFRCRGFFLKQGVPEERVKYLEWAFKKAWQTDQFQAFNKKKYMHLMDSYRDMEGSIKLLKSMINTYSDAYEAMGIKKK